MRGSIFSISLNFQQTVTALTLEESCNMIVVRPGGWSRVPPREAEEELTVLALECWPEPELLETLKRLL